MTTRTTSRPPSDESTRSVAARLENEPYIDDDGFTARVVEGLPPKRRRSALVYAMTPAAAAAGCVLAFLLQTHAPPALHPHGLSAVWLSAAMLMSFALLAWATTAEA